MSVTNQPTPNYSTDLYSKVLTALGVSEAKIAHSLLANMKSGATKEDLSNTVFSKILHGAEGLRKEKDRTCEKLYEKEIECEVLKRKLEKALEAKTKLEVDAKTLLSPHLEEKAKQKQELDIVQKANRELKLRLDASETKRDQYKLTAEDLRKKVQSLGDKEKKAKADAVCQVDLLTDVKSLETTCWQLHLDNQRLVVDLEEKIRRIGRLTARVHDEKAKQIEANNKRQHLFNENFDLYGQITHLRGLLSHQGHPATPTYAWSHASNDTSSSSDSKSQHDEQNF